MSNVGRENWYSCDACGEIMVTVDVDEGTTPMLTECRATWACEGIARFGWYGPKPLGAGVAKWEWYRPSPSRVEAKSMSAETRLHVRLGGLLLRPGRFVP